MVKVKGRLITFTGKDRTDLLAASKKMNMTPRNYLMFAIETHARNILFHDALQSWDEKDRIQGVQLKTEIVKLRREGTD